MVASAERLMKGESYKEGTFKMAFHQKPYESRHLGNCKG